MSAITINKNGDFFTIKGKGTFQEKENIKEIGGVWNNSMKAWMVSQQRETEMRDWYLATLEAERENDLKKWQKKNKEQEKKSVPSEDKTLLNVLKIVKELRNEVKELRKEIKKSYRCEQKKSYRCEQKEDSSDYYSDSD